MCCRTKLRCCHPTALRARKPAGLGSRGSGLGGVQRFTAGVYTFVTPEKRGENQTTPEKEELMTKQWMQGWAGLCAIVLGAGWLMPVQAQMAEVKEKPPMYTYEGSWAIPRGQWGEMEKGTADEGKRLQKAMAAGTIVGYGDDTNMVHQADGYTHDGWWSAMSMAGILSVLEQEYKSGSATSPVYQAATKHEDSILVSRFYNWHPGTYKDVYTHASTYKLKADAPADAVEMLSKSLFVPLMEKMLADGAIHEYEVDTEAIHTDAPGTFMLVYITANAEGLDKVNAAVRDAVKANSMVGPTLNSLVDFSQHRDYLARTNATYK